jgi:hypothetical protein
MAFPPRCRFRRLSRYGDEEPGSRRGDEAGSFVLGDETCFVVFEAEAADVVAEAGRRAGLAFERIVAAIEAS